jgi:hypothetical protein
MNIGESFSALYSSMGGGFLNDALYTAIFITLIIMAILIVMCPMKQPWWNTIKVLFYIFIAEFGTLIVFKGVNKHQEHIEMGIKEDEKVVTAAVESAKNIGTPIGVINSAAEAPIAQGGAAPHEANSHEPQIAEESTEKLLEEIEHRFVRSTG